MKMQLGAVIAASACLGMAGCANQKPVAHEPMFVVTTPVVELKAGSVVQMYGTGFTPKQELMLLFKDPGGGMTGLSSVTKPTPVPNQEGMWAAAWDISSYLRTFKPGTGVLSVNDKDYKMIGQAPVVLVAPPKPKPEAKPAAKPEAKPEAGAARR